MNKLFLERKPWKRNNTHEKLFFKKENLEKENITHGKLFLERLGKAKGFMSSQKTRPFEEKPRKRINTCKGFTQVDYIIATGIFLVVFALVVQYVNIFFSDVTAKTNVVVMTTEANSMLGIAEHESSANMIGLVENAYRLYITVNNSRQAWKDQGKDWVNITNEIVAFNYTDIGIPAAVNSTAIYDDSGNTVAYNINGNTITFNTSIAVNSTKNFTVYFDTDSNFTSSSVAVAGADNLSETAYPVQKMEILQYRKLVQLNGTNYTTLKNSTQTPRDFRITITDVFTNLIFFDYGPAPPPSGNIVAMRRFVAYQNSTAGIRRGALNVQVW